MRKTARVIVMQPVLEIYASDGFALWPIAEVESFGYLPLSAGLGPAEIGTAIMSIAGCNDVDPEQDGRPPRPADPLGSFLHGLSTFDDLFAAGGMRVVDGSQDVTFVPGCCNGLEDWRDWHEVVDGSGRASFGHDPDPVAERLGDTVRLTVDAERSDSAVIDLSVTELRRLVEDAERDLTDFHAAAAGWVSRYLPDHFATVTAALARALALPASAGSAGSAGSDGRR
jgi:hypothetical protein